MNELQKTELEMLTIFTEICETLRLHWFVVCGTALGAVKYGGFIPWDDDIDVALPREDYEIFLREAPKLLPGHIFLQNYHSDPAFPHIYSKLRNSNTTYIEAGAAHLDMHHGVYIDVFPLDGYPGDPREARRFERKKKVYSWMQYCALRDGRKLRVRLRNWAFRCLGFHRRTAKTLARMESLYCRYPARDSNIWCNQGNWQGKREYAPKGQYGDGLWLTFEGLPVRVPADFDAYLTQKYGNWRQEPPKTEQVGSHRALVCDLNRPYTDYAARKEKLWKKAEC